MGRACGVLLLIAALLGVSAPAGAATRPKKLAMLFGDSLTYESTWAMKPPAAWTLQVGALGSLAICDFLDMLPDALAEHPVSVAFESAGSWVRPCMQSAGAGTLGSDAYFKKITSDIDEFFSEDAQAGVRTVFIEPPPVLDPAWNADINRIISIATSLAANYPSVVLSKTARNAVSKSGKYVAYKACTKAELIQPGCVNKQIAVRTVTGDQTGQHLCPDGISTSPPYQCDEYSSGEHRFGPAEARAAMARL